MTLLQQPFHLTLLLFDYPDSVVLESSVKPSLGCMIGSPRLGLTEDSRTTDFRLGLLVVILIRMQTHGNYPHM